MEAMCPQVPTLVEDERTVKLDPLESGSERSEGEKGGSTCHVFLRFPIKKARRPGECALMTSSVVVIVESSDARRPQFSKPEPRLLRNR